MGDLEIRALALVESSLGYHSCNTEVLTIDRESGLGTLSVGQFDWGGRLLKCNGGAQRFSQHGRKSCVECKGTRELDCERYISSRNESWT